MVRTGIRQGGSGCNLPAESGRSGGRNAFVRMKRQSQRSRDKRIRNRWAGISGIKLLLSAFVLTFFLYMPETGIHNAAAAVYTDAETVRDVQEYLNSHGYSCGMADGIIGPRTRAAIRAYQESCRIYPDGQISDALLQLVRRSGAGEAAEDGLDVRILDVGQGLSVILECGGEFAVYDGGPGTASAKVVSALRELDARELSCVIASHYDEDHLNGIIGILHVLPVQHLLAPDYETDTSIYRSFLHAVEANGVVVTHPDAGDVYELGGARLQVLMPLRKSYEEENDRSIVIRVVYEDTSVLLPGDCSFTGEEDMIRSGEDLNSTILVLGHHGSAYSTSQDFLDAVNPEFAVISCGDDNTYGHPSRDVMTRLKQEGIRIFRTDAQGDIHLQSDGDEWFTDKEFCSDYSYRIPGEISHVRKMDNKDKTDDKACSDSHLSDPDFLSSRAEHAYILNLNSHKFHYSECPAAEKMRKENRREIVGSREEIIQMGYLPCGICNP